MLDYFIKMRPKPFYKLAVKTTYKELLDKADKVDFLANFIEEKMNPMCGWVNLIKDDKFDFNLFIISPQRKVKTTNELLKNFREFLNEKDALNDVVLFNPSYQECRCCAERYILPYFTIDIDKLHKKGDEIYDTTLELLEKCGFKDEDIIHIII